MTKQVTERELVLAILMEVTQQNVYSHLALNAVLEKYQYLEKKERAFITRVTEGTLEHMIELDYILNQFSKVKGQQDEAGYPQYFEKCCISAEVYGQRAGFGSVQRGSKAGSEKRIRHPAWICKRSAPTIVARGLDQVEYPTEGIERLSVVYSMPEWILKLWKKTYDLDVIESMLQAFQEVDTG